MRCDYNERKDIGIFDIPTIEELDTFPIIATWEAEKGEYKQGNALHNAVWICLFSDKLTVDGMQFAKTNSGGWAGGEIGSYLHTLYNMFVTDEVIELARVYALEALQTLINQEVVVKIDCETGRISKTGIYIDIVLYGSDGTVVFNERFTREWQN